ncbi:MAG: squalene synthase HpnC [Chloroflexota bacterium]
MTPEIERARLDEACRSTRRLARSHYENFVVVSWLLPRALRQPMYDIYAFCRTVDDLGDEANGDRLALLDRFEEKLGECFSGRPSEPLFVALAHTIERHHLPQEPFLALIDANRQDQRVSRYDTYAELEAYCRLSANPVGRLVLGLFGYQDEERCRLSDATCTGLQLANFWQDVGEDYRRGRVYLPLEDLRRFGYEVAELARGETNDAWRRLMAFEVERARSLLWQGRALIPLGERRLRVDLELFSMGGLEILREIEATGFDVFASRPRIPGWRQVGLVARAVASHALGRGKRGEPGRAVGAEGRPIRG